MSKEQLVKPTSFLDLVCDDDSNSDVSWEDCDDDDDDDSDSSESEGESGALAFQRALQSFMANHMGGQVLQPERQTPHRARQTPLHARRTVPKEDAKASKELKERFQKRKAKRQKIEAVKGLVDLSKMNGVRKVPPKIKEPNFLEQLMKKPHMFFSQ